MKISAPYFSDIYSPLHVMGAWEQGNTARYILKSMLKPVMKTKRKILGSQKKKKKKNTTTGTPKVSLFPGPHSASVLES